MMKGNKSSPALALRGTFPEILMITLNEAAADDTIASIISWDVSGTCFFINEQNLFEKIVIPKFFPGIKYSSFTRRLNRWNFHLIRSGPNRGAYFHALFRRDNPKLCLKMTHKLKPKKKSRSNEQAVGTSHMHENPNSVEQIDEIPNISIPSSILSSDDVRPSGNACASRSLCWDTKYAFSSTKHLDKIPSYVTAHEFATAATCDVDHNLNQNLMAASLASSSMTKTATRSKSAPPFEKRRQSRDQVARPRDSFSTDTETEEILSAFCDIWAEYEAREKAEQCGQCISGKPTVDQTKRKLTKKSAEAA